MRGDGRIFQRKESAVWWISFYHRGQEIRESSRSPEKKDAEKLLRQRLREIGADRMGLKTFVGPSQDRVAIDELLDALEKYYELRGKKSRQFLDHARPIREFFGDRRAIEVTEEAIERFISGRLSEGKAPATVNRETQILGQAFRLAVERRRLSAAPKIHRLPERNARQGFFERGEFEAVAEKLPDYLQDFARFGYLTGWRKGEIASLTWADVDLAGRVIRLRPEESKNGKPRLVPLEGELWQIIERRWTARQILTPDGVTLASLVFHRNGLPIGDIRKAWASACKAAGAVGRLFHDLRRTAIRNMVRAGVPERVAMEISGHKTRSIFDRYNIVSENDLRQAVQKTQAHLATLPKERTVLPFQKAKNGASE